MFLFHFLFFVKETHQNSEKTEPKPMKKCELCFAKSGTKEKKHGTDKD